MKQIFSAKFGKSLQKLEETSFLIEESFRDNNIDSSDFYPIIHLITEIVSNTILFDKMLPSNSEFELRIYLNSVITCIVESNSLCLESTEFKILNGKLSSPFYEDKIERIDFKNKNHRSSVLFQSKSLQSFKTFYN